VSGRQRLHPSNAARQAAYRRRVAARRAALADAAGGRFYDAVERLNALSAERLSLAAADRDRLKAERDQFERDARAARRLLRQATARAEEAERRVARLELRIENIQPSALAVSSPRVGRSSSPLRQVLRDSGATGEGGSNRAQRRARDKRKGRRR
jgi:hypothetical protein